MIFKGETLISWFVHCINTENTESNRCQPGVLQESERLRPFSTAAQLLHTLWRTNRWCWMHPFTKRWKSASSRDISTLSDRYERAAEEVTEALKPLENSHNNYGALWIHLQCQYHEPEIPGNKWWTQSHLKEKLWMLQAFKTPSTNAQIGPRLSVWMVPGIRETTSSSAQRACSV